MHRIQEMIRLHRLGRGQRAVARQLRMGRDTVRTYHEKLGEAGLLDGPADELPGVGLDEVHLRDELGELFLADGLAHLLLACLARAER